MYFTLFLISLISHILGDFVFQSDKIVQGREGANNVKYKWYISSGKYNLIHAFIHWENRQKCKRGLYKRFDLR